MVCVGITGELAFMPKKTAAKRKGTSDDAGDALECYLS